MCIIFISRNAFSWNDIIFPIENLKNSKTSINDVQHIDIKQNTPKNNISGYTKNTISTDLYLKWKEKLHNDYGFDYRIRAGFMIQRGSPNGGKTVFRDKYEIEANWDIFSSEKFGNGSIQFLYEDINYPGISGTTMASNLSIAAPINDDIQKREYFRRLTYTHQLPNDLKNISLSVGQFLIGKFTKTSYKSIPLSHFNNYTLQKNATKAYPTGGFGGYITYNPMSNLTLITGLQSTTNYAPQNISIKHLNDNKWTNFIYTSWTPKLTDLGKTILTGWIYHSPAIKKYSGQFNKAFQKPANGYTITLRQDIDKWTGLIKINGATGNRMASEQSYSAQFIYNNPLNRNKLDQIGLGGVFNKISGANKKSVRSWENVLEGYWAFGISDYLTIMPDVQLYINPALTRNRNIIVVNSIQVKFYL